MSALLVSLLAPLVLAPTHTDAIKVDAFFNEWESRPVWTVRPVRGAALDGPGDCSARIQLAWSPQYLFFAAQVVDDAFTYGDGVQGDRLSFTWADHRLEIVLRDLEDRPPQAKLDGKAVRGAKLVGTYRKDGWAVEGRLPWRAIPDLLGEARPVAAIIHDADRKRAEQSVLANTSIDAALKAKTTTLEIGPTAGLYAQYRSQHDDTDPIRTLRGNLGGSKALDEEVVISESAIVVYGHGLPKNMGYTFATHGWRTGAKLVEAKLVDVDRDGVQEIWVVHTEWAVPDQIKVEIAELWGVKGPGLTPLFAQETGVWIPGRKRAAQSEVTLGRKRITVKPAKVEGFNPGNWRAFDPPDMPFEPLLLPWENKRPVVYKRQKDGRYAR